MCKLTAIVLFYFTWLISDGQEFKWAIGEGAHGWDYGTCITSDQFNNIYVAGSFNDTIDFDPGPGVLNLIATGTSGGSDIFIQKLDPNGSFIWASAMGGSHHDYSAEIACSGDGGLVITGYFDSYMDIDPDTAVTNLIYSNGSQDIFAMKLNGSNGALVWGAGMGSGYDDEGLALAIDQDNNVILTGRFQATADFDPGAGGYYIATNHWYDAFVLKLGPDYVGISDRPVNGVSFSLYPNPANNYTVIESKGQGVLEVLDIAGKPIRQVSLHAGGTEVSTQDLPNGVYLLRFGSFSKKLVIQR